MEIEDDIKLADVPEILVQDLDVVVDDLQIYQLIVLLIDQQQEIQRSVTLVDNLVLLPLNEIAQP